MSPLSMFPLPLPPNGPPVGYGWEEHNVSLGSTTTACDKGLDTQVRFGKPRCVICGLSGTGSRFLERCYIIKDSEPDTWLNLKDRHWIPSLAKENPLHEPYNILLMCPNHHALFDEYCFFIRFFPEIHKFVFVNYSNSNDRDLQPFHGKAIALDVHDPHAPLPSLFIMHEMRVRGFYPFEPVAPDMPSDIPWQDWVLSDGVFDNASGCFICDELPSNNGGNNNTGVPAQLQLPAMSAGDTSSGEHTLALNQDVIAEILAATRASASWKACEMEGTSWTGTAEENK